MKNKTSNRSEWVGGIVRPTLDEGLDPSTSFGETLLWIMPGGRVGMTIGPVGESLSVAAESLAHMTEHRAAKTPAPARIRVASPALAATLRAAFPSLEIVVAPTPEVLAKFGDGVLIEA